MRSGIPACGDGISSAKHIVRNSALREDKWGFGKLFAERKKVMGVPEDWNLEEEIQGVMNALTQKDSEMLGTFQISVELE